MKVFVISKDNKPLMPCSPRKARLLLKSKRARVLNLCPFTIQLIFHSTEYTQDITLGVDAGSKNIGLSASTEKEELFTSEVQLRTDIVEKLSERRQYRRTRRNRLRYRKARFLNRVSSKKKGWLPPSTRQKISSHLKVIASVHKILPITKIVVETASFDIQKIKNHEIEGVGYQQGEQLGFWNVRQYVLARDGHKCRNPRCKTKDKILEVHHIESRQTGGDSPNNLITLCSTCHKAYHKGSSKVSFSKGHSFRDAAFMSTMRWSLYTTLKELYADVTNTYGYITKNTRIKAQLAKTHSRDSYCIANNLSAEQADVLYIQKFVRSKNRQIHKANFLKGGRKKLNQAAKYVKDFKLFDKVLFLGQECFIFGRRVTGYFDLRTLEGQRIHNSASYKKLTLLQRARNILISKKAQFLPAHKGRGLLVRE